MGILRLVCAALVLVSGVPAAAGTGDTDGNPVETLALDELQRMISERQQPLLIVVMAAWCHPCIQELPDLQRLYDEYRPRGLDMLGISLDLQGPQAMQPIIDRLNIRFPVYWVGEAAVEAFEIRGIPLLMLVRNGDIEDRILGLRSADYLEGRISEFLQ